MNWFKNLKLRKKLLLAFIIVLIFAISAGAFSIIQMQSIDESYAEAMDLTSQRIGYIFASKDNLSRARMIMREVFYPDTTRYDLHRLSAELSNEMNMLESQLRSLQNVAVETNRDTVGAILPQVERYRADSLETIGILLAVEDVSIYNPEYVAALISAEARTISIGASYANEMTTAINGLSDASLDALRDLAAEQDALAKGAVMITIGLFVIMAALTLCITFYLSHQICKPLNVFSTFMKKAGSTGDITILPEDVKIIGEYGAYKDEIGQTICNCAVFIKHVTNIAEELEAMAGGDLTVEIEALSELDTLGTSLLKMEEGLNSMFTNVRQVSEQVAGGSKQVADGAQSLAMGAIDQAAAIQELSNSIAEISEKTTENAATAERTSKLSETIKENAEKGSRQMDDMIAAVKDIDDASNSISKIIKTIDDIAFQTNILALNAAVEAARAGAHGKGFAVVADEVRSLAAKSAHAAKETGDMIQNTMEKAKHGSSIAGETAMSLTEIVAGINESSLLVEEIARASEQQSVGVSQINVGIDHVAQVVHQNSATAQQSAATSQEMSSQSALLQELISSFKLSNGKGKYTDMASYEEKMSMNRRQQNTPKYISAHGSYEDLGKFA